MSKELSQVETQSTTNSNKHVSPLKNNAFTMLASFTGVVFGVLGSLGFVTSYLHSALANQTAALNRTLSVRNADLTSQCVSSSSAATSGGSGAGVQTASAVTPGMGAGGGAGSGAGGGNSFVHQLTNGVLTSTGTISNTGQGSSNQVNSTLNANMTVHNENNLSATNNNPQVATSGSAQSNQNTTGGSADSGDSGNSSSSSFSYTVNN